MKKSIVRTAVCLFGIAIPYAHSQNADLSRLVIVGDSLAAGFQNGSLLGRQQENSFVNLVGHQAGVSLRQPSIGWPGIPNVQQLVDPGPPPIVERVRGTSSGRIWPTVQAANLAVPGHTVQDALTLRPDLAFDDLTDLVLGLPGLLAGISFSQVEWAEALQPTMAVIWLGGNDALGAALFADPAAMTPQADFELAFAEVMSRVAATGAQLVVLNVPDVTTVPYLTSAQELADMLGQPLGLIGPPLGIAAGDYVTPDAIPLALEILTGAIPGPLPADVVLDASEVDVARNVVAGFNAFIVSQSQQHGAALVDVHLLLDRLDRGGFPIGNYELSTRFLGGIFSLDGIHPTNSGHGLIANHVLRSIEQTFGGGIPTVPLLPIVESDPLAFPIGALPFTTSPPDADLRQLLGWMVRR
ncbi:MAG: hypothetical protein GY711_27915 [bacterium]|nr:hypothetical protein [bacterium]